MQLKILSWNIWYDGYFEEISNFLKTFDADIIGLQEVVPDDSKRDTVDFLNKLGYSHVLAPVLKLEDGRKMSNAIFSKHPIVGTETYILSETDSRKAIRADIQIGDKILHIFTTHLLHTHQKPSETQELQAKNLINALSKENMIVTGDFNATPESNAIKLMNEDFVNTDPELAPTWSVYPEGCLVCNPQAIDIRLDYIFTSKDMKTSSPEVHQSKGSDHLPISVIIEI